MNTIPGNTALPSVSAAAEFKLFATADVNVQNNNVRDKTISSVATSASSNSVATAEQVDEALQVVNKAAVFEQRSLSFMLDEASGKSIIKVMDKNTEQLIRQIPSQELLKVAQDIKRLQDEMGQSLGFLIDRRV